MKTIIITRKYWGQNQLRSPNGTKCCLGFACEAYGVPAEKTLDETYPWCLEPKLQKKLPKWLRSGVDDEAVRLAAAINDDYQMKREAKEEKLKELFLKHKIRLIFRGAP